VIRNLLKRSVDEAFSAAALVASGAVSIAPPQRYLRTLRGLRAYGQLGLLVSAGAQLHGDTTAIVDERGSSTFRELDERSNALANAWLAAGFTPGASVGILCRNHRWLFEALAAAAKVLGTRTKVDTVNRALEWVAGRDKRLELLDVLDTCAQDLSDPEVMRHAWRHDD